MNNIKSSRSLLFLIFLLFFNCLNAHFSFDELNDYDAAKLRAGEDGKLIFIAFSAKWCMPCKILEESTLNNPEIKAILSKDYISVKIDIENQKGHQWKDKFQVQLVPTIIILDSKGKVLNKTENTLASSPFKNLIESHNTSQNKQVIYSRKQYVKRKYKAKPVPKTNSTSSPRYSSTYSKPYTKKKSTNYTKPSTSTRTISSRTRSNSSASQSNKTVKISPRKTTTRKYSNAKKSNASSRNIRKKSSYAKTNSNRKKSNSKRSKSIAKKRKKTTKKRTISGRTIRKKPIAQGNVYKVKIGNYSKYDTAKKSLQRVQKLNLGSAKILEYKEGRKSRYKIIVGRFYQRDEANSLLKSLNRKGYQGTVVAYKQ
jgi:thioredoxin-related protein